jgi:signal transduction histidine kinase
LAPSRKNIEIAIKNYGHIIEKEMMDVIFEPFSRLRAKGVQEMAGTGLGLPTVRRICELHGWNLSLTSGTDSGTVFIINIPDGQAQ